MGIAVSYRGVSFAYPGSAFGPEAGGGPVRVDDVSETNGPRPALESISLDVLEGERLGVLGPNGGGKSTLIKLTLGLLPRQSGEIRIFGKSVEEARRAGLIGYVPQRSHAELAFPLSARQVVEMAATVRLRPWQGMTREAREHVDEALQVVGVTELGKADAPVASLSGGQFQRVMIARALAAKPRLLLLDEPTVGIDVAGQQQFASLLEGIVKRLGVTVIVVSHDLRAIAAGCDRVACLSRTLHSHVAPGGLTPAVLAEVFRHDVAAIFGDLHVDAHRASDCADPSHAHSHSHVDPKAPVQLGIDPAMRKSAASKGGTDANA